MSLRRGIRLALPAEVFLHVPHITAAEAVRSAPPTRERELTGNKRACLLAI